MQNIFLEFNEIYLWFQQEADSHDVPYNVTHEERDLINRDNNKN